MPYLEERPTVRILMLCATCNTHAEKSTLKDRYNCKHVFTPHGGSFAFAEANVELAMDEEFAEANVELALDEFITIVTDEDFQGNDVEFVLVDRLSCPDNPVVLEDDQEFDPEDQLRLETRYEQHRVAQWLKEQAKPDAVPAEEGLIFINSRLEEVYVPILGVTS